MSLLEFTNYIIGEEKIELPNGLGDSPNNPLLLMIDSVPYGAYFRCSVCQEIGRSIVSCDCYGDVGDPLKCERCVHE